MGPQSRELSGTGDLVFGLWRCGRGKKKKSIMSRWASGSSGNQIGSSRECFRHTGDGILKAKTELFKWCIVFFNSIEHHISYDKQAGLGTLLARRYTKEHTHPFSTADDPAQSGSGSGAYLSYLRANNLDNLPIYRRTNAERQTTIYAHTLKWPVR